MEKSPSAQTPRVERIVSVLDKAHRNHVLWSSIYDIYKTGLDDGMGLNYGEKRAVREHVAAYRRPED